MDERTRQQQAIAALRQQRDTLLAALKEVVQPIRNAEYALSRVAAGPLVKEALADTRNGLRGVQAAIAAVEEE